MSCSGCKFLVEVCKEPPSQCQTIADAAGAAYKAHALAILILRATSLLGWALPLYVILTRNLSSSGTSQLVITFLMCHGALVIAVIDTNGWRGWIPPAVSTFADVAAFGLVMHVVVATYTRAVRTLDPFGMRRKFNVNLLRVVQISYSVGVAAPAGVRFVFPELDWVFGALTTTFATICMLLFAPRDTAPLIHVRSRARAYVSGRHPVLPLDAAVAAPSPRDQRQETARCRQVRTALSRSVAADSTGWLSHTVRLTERGGC